MKKHKGLVSILVLFLACGVLALVSWIPVTEHIKLDMVDGNVRIALVTDLHSCYYGPNQRWLTDRIDKESPDVIFLGGDIFDDGLPDDNARKTIEYTHRPEKVDVYSRYDFDLILAGHAHAGQMKIPFLNIGLFAPDQGYFAKYVDGLYTLENGSVMEVSRGLSRESTRLPRLFNRPEVVVMDLY